MMVARHCKSNAIDDIRPKTKYQPYSHLNSSERKTTFCIDDRSPRLSLGLAFFLFIHRVNYVICSTICDIAVDSETHMLALLVLNSDYIASYMCFIDIHENQPVSLARACWVSVRPEPVGFQSAHACYRSELG
jgi:hypothetical protein